MTTCMVVDDRPYCRALWTDISRPVEFDAFGLVLGIHVTAVQRDIHWQRMSQSRRDWEDYVWRVRLMYSTFRYYAGRFKGLTREAHKQLAAQRLGVSLVEVNWALVEAEHLGVGELV